MGYGGAASELLLGISDDEGGRRIATYHKATYSSRWERGEDRAGDGKSAHHVKLRVGVSSHTSAPAVRIGSCSQFPANLIEFAKTSLWGAY